jgi:hypothetical protein
MSGSDETHRKRIVSDVMSNWLALLTILLLMAPGISIDIAVCIKLFRWIL